MAQLQGAFCSSGENSPPTLTPKYVKETNMRTRASRKLGVASPRNPMKVRELFLAMSLAVTGARLWYTGATPSGTLPDGLRPLSQEQVLGRPFSIILLLVLALPVFGIRLGFGDAGNRPTSDSARRAYDLIAEGFGAGANGPLVLVADSPGGGPVDMDALGRLAQAVDGSPDVAAVSPPIPNEGGDGALLIVQPESSPQDEATETLGSEWPLVCRSDLSEDLVYELTREFFAQLPAMARQHREAALIDPEQAPATPIPLHPGAARYYREREILR